MGANAGGDRGSSSIWWKLALGAFLLWMVGGFRSRTPAPPSSPVVPSVVATPPIVSPPSPPTPAIEPTPAVIEDDVETIRAAVEAARAACRAKHGDIIGLDVIEGRNLGKPGRRLVLLGRDGETHWTGGWFLIVDGGKVVQDGPGETVVWHTEGPEAALRDVLAGESRGFPGPWVLDSTERPAEGRIVGTFHRESDGVRVRVLARSDDVGEIEPIED